MQLCLRYQEEIRMRHAVFGVLPVLVDGQEAEEGAGQDAGGGGGGNMQERLAHTAISQGGCGGGGWCRLWGEYAGVIQLDSRLVLLVGGGAGKAGVVRWHKGVPGLSRCRLAVCAVWWPAAFVWLRKEYVEGLLVV